ncbi:MAG: hypothetical protein JXL97_17635 [Bacteroidales bacterium]|nr:hypothetical protein [Bacteroidales bacterium]
MIILIIPVLIFAQKSGSGIALAHINSVYDGKMYIASLLLQDEILVDSDEDIEIISFSMGLYYKGYWDEKSFDGNVLNQTVKKSFQFLHDGESVFFHNIVAINNTNKDTLLLNPVRIVVGYDSYYTSDKYYNPERKYATLYGEFDGYFDKRTILGESFIRLFDAEVLSFDLLYIQQGIDVTFSQNASFLSSQMKNVISKARIGFCFFIINIVALNYPNEEQINVPIIFARINN